MMNTQNTVLSKKLTGFFLLLFLVATTLLVGCSDDPEPVNEEELITTVNIMLTPVGGSSENAVTLSWDDLNLNGVVDAGEIEQVVLYSRNAYTASIELLNKSVDPTEDITEEVREEAEDHLFCFEASGVNIAFSNFDKDANDLNVGLTSTWTTTAATGSGTVNIKLRHQPGTKTGSCTGGDTDIDITFPIEVASLPL